MRKNSLRRKKLVRRIGEGCACKRNPVLWLSDEQCSSPRKNPRARTGRGFDARALHAWNK